MQEQDHWKYISIGIGSKIGQITEAKHRQALLILGWTTAWKDFVLEQRSKATKQNNETKINVRTSH